MSLSETSEDETELQTPRFIRKNSRFSMRSCTPGTPSSIVSSIVFGPISEEVLRIWSTLPEAIRLDPSLAAIQREYERVSLNAERSRMLNIQEGDAAVVNMSSRQYSSEKKIEIPALLDVCPEISGTSKSNAALQDASNISLRAQIEDPADEERNLEAQVHGHNQKQRPFYRYTKLVSLTCCWIIFTIILMTKSEKIPSMHQISVPRNQVRNYVLPQNSSSQRLSITLEGSLLPPRDDESNANFSSSNRLIVWLGFSDDEFDNSSNDTYSNANYPQNLSEAWIIPVLPQDLVDVFPDQKHQKIFDLKNLQSRTKNGTIRSIVVNLRTNLPSSLPVSIAYDFSPINTQDGIAYAAVVLLGLYILIIFEIVHRALAAMLASTMSLAILAAMDERPTMTELISWIDVDTLLLLFSMMILVAIFAETGVFDYLAVYAYKITGGKLWPLINTLCFFTAFISTLLDNVTTVLLMTPVTIRLCEVMELNPVPILTAMVVYSNIGGAATPVGDPPNVIIASNRDVIAAGVGFSNFVMHMGVGVLVVLLVIYGQLRYIFRDVAVLGFDEPQDVQELRHEIAIWQRAAASLSSYSKDENLVRETLMKKVKRLLALLKKKLITGSVAFEKYKTTLEELQEKYPIRDKWLLIKSSIALLFVITLFFLHNVPHLNLSLGWTALLGVLLLLVLADTEDIDGLLARVEWSTLLFFASLFILMEALSRLGLIAWVGKLTESVILSVNEESRLAVAILLILWVSAFASAFVDNVPLATMMVRIATSLSKNQELGLPLQPLIWALAFGACMGGNATLIGATANVVCAGVAEQHGYRFTFMQFFKFGFPVMLTSTATVTVYLMLCHVVFNWV